MLVETVVISLLVALVRRGRLRNLENIRIKAWYLFVIGLLIQTTPAYVSIFNSGRLVEIVSRYYLYFHLLSYILIFITLIFNSDMLSMKVIAFGTILNFAAIFSNKGYMPVSGAAIKATGYDKMETLTNQLDYKHVLWMDNTRLKALTDIFPTPALYPFHQILSIGDLFIMLGIFLLIQKAMVVGIGKNSSR